MTEVSAANKHARNEKKKVENLRTCIMSNAKALPCKTNARENRACRAEKCRHRPRRKRTDHVEIIHKSDRAAKQTYKGGQKKEICKEKSEENDEKKDKNEIPKLCAHFHTEVYSTTLQV